MSHPTGGTKLDSNQTEDCTALQGEILSFLYSKIHRNFGDCFLVRQNIITKKTRNATTQKSCTYVEAEPNL